LSDLRIQFERGILTAICCECGLKMSIVPDLAVMGQKIEDHAIRHKNKETDPSKAEVVFNRVQDQLTMKVLQRISQSN